jgi:hypothetical protein
LPLGAECQLVARAEEDAGPSGRGRAVDMWVEVGAGDRDKAWMLGDEARTAERAFQRCVSRIIANEEVCGRMRKSIHGAAGLDAGADRAWTPEILNRGEQTGLLDVKK